MSHQEAAKTASNEQSKIKSRDTEVVPKAKRRQFSLAYKKRLLEEVDACSESGQVGSILRREGLYSSHLSTWRRQRERGELNGQSRGRPQVKETLAGDEIYANGQPNLLVVGNDTLFICQLSRQQSCDGETWGCILLDVPEPSQFVSDGGSGLAAGVKEAGIKVHQSDWDHLLRPLWGQAARLEQQAYAVLEAVEARAAKFDQASTAGRLAQHLKVWEKLTAKAEEKIGRYDAFSQIARHVDHWFALIDLTSGQLCNPIEGTHSLRHLAQQLVTWPGRVYQKLSRNLDSFADRLFSYHPVLTAALAPPD